MKDPQTLDELIERVPAFGRTRSLTMESLRHYLGRKKGQCTGCGKQVPKGRRTWCSPECAEAITLRCVPEVARNFVLKRDNGICQRCRVDTVQAAKEFFRRWTEEVKAQQKHGKEWKETRIDLHRRLVEETGGPNAEVDHIVPVSEGGGLCGPDNLQTLCYRCHAAKTHKKKGRQ